VYRTGPGVNGSLPAYTQDDWHDHTVKLHLTDEYRLLRDLMSYYEPAALPSINKSDVVRVNMGIALFQIRELVCKPCGSSIEVFQRIPALILIMLSTYTLSQISLGRIKYMRCGLLQSMKPAFVCHAGGLCKKAKRIDVLFWSGDSWGPKKHCIRRESRFSLRI